MAKTVLLTIGRLPKALDLARSFSAAGYRVIVADPFAWHLLRVSNAVTKTYQVTAPATDRDTYLRDLLGIVAREGVSLIVPVSEESMYVTALRNRLPAGVTLAAMPHSDCLRLHNKLQFPRHAADLGLDVPETYDVTDARAVVLATRSDYVVKPIYSCSGRGVSLHQAGEPLPVTQEPAVAQQRLYGDLYSTFSIAQGGRRRVTVVYRAAIMSGTVAVCFERVEGQTAIEDWIDQFIGLSAATGFVSFDMIVDATGKAFAIECNPRATSGIHFVHPDDLARAITDPDDETNVRLKDARVMQQFYPCLTETQMSFFRRTSFKRNFKYLTTAPDVTWSLSDPLPLLLMPMTSWQIISRAMKLKQSFGEASTFDISWRDRTDV